MSVYLAPDDLDLAQYMLETEGRHKVKSPAAWEREVVDSFFAPEEAKGTRMPWPMLHGFRLRSGEVTVWGGYNESRKSILTGQVMLACADQGEGAVIASFEMTPLETIKRLARQWLVKAEPSVQEIKEFIRWCEGKIWIYDQLGHCDAKKLFAVMRYCADTLKAKHFIVDSLMRVVRDTDDWNSQKALVDQMVTIAKDTGMHLHLVAHNKKPDGFGKKSSRYDVKGASEISDLAFNVVIIERPEDDNGKRPDDQPDAWLKIAKQRNHNWKGSIRLYLQGETGAFSDNKTHMSVEFGTRRGVEF
jgi:twinkle protein